MTSSCVFRSRRWQISVIFMPGFTYDCTYLTETTLEAFNLAFEPVGALHQPEHTRQRDITAGLADLLVVVRGQALQLAG